MSSTCSSVIYPVTWMDKVCPKLLPFHPCFVHCKNWEDSRLQVLNVILCSVRTTVTAVFYVKTKEVPLSHLQPKKNSIKENDIWKLQRFGYLTRPLFNEKSINAISFNILFGWLGEDRLVVEYPNVAGDHVFKSILNNVCVLLVVGVCCCF